MVEGACIPLIAKQRWPTINDCTTILFTQADRVRVPALTCTGWWLNQRWLEIEDIDLHWLVGVPGVSAAGYGNKSNVLALRQ